MYLLYILYIFLIFHKSIIETIYLESKVAHIFHKTILSCFVRKLTSDITDKNRLFCYWFVVLLKKRIYFILVCIFCSFRESLNTWEKTERMAKQFSLLVSGNSQVWDIQWQTRTPQLKYPSQPPPFSRPLKSISHDEVKSE